MKKHCGTKITLIAFTILMITVAVIWSMFNTQLLEERTKLLPPSVEPTVHSDKENDAKSYIPNTENDRQYTEITLPILDEINQIKTTGSSMTAVQSAAQLLDWGINTGLDPVEIKAATVAWLVDKGNDEQVEFAKKLALVDEFYQKILKGEADDLLTSASCADVTYSMNDTPIESIEAIMEAVGLR